MEIECLSTADSITHLCPAANVNSCCFYCQSPSAWSQHSDDLFKVSSRRIEHVCTYLVLFTLKIVHGKH